VSPNNWFLVSAEGKIHHHEKETSPFFSCFWVLKTGQSKWTMETSLSFLEVSKALCVKRRPLQGRKSGRQRRFADLCRQL